MRTAAVLTCLALTLACNDDTTVADTDTGDPSSSGSGTTDDPDPDTESGPAPETETETDTGETGEPGPYCGDGTVDLGEECDDGNGEELDGCSNACKSACGAEFWVDVSIEGGWFDVRTMSASGNDGLLAAGDIEIDGEIGRVRVVELSQSQVVDDREGTALGPAGTPDLPQTHQIDALTFVDGGELLALGTSTVVEIVDEPATVSYWLARFDANLVEVWRVPILADDVELRPRDVAALAGGDALITMTTQVADNDRDIQIQRLAGLDGAEVWTATHSGEENGGWSLDSAGLVAVGDGDRVWAAGIVRVDWQTFETTILELDPADGALLWSAVPIPDTGSGHEQRIVSLAAGPGGAVGVGIGVLGPASQYSYGAAALYVEHELAWTVTPDDLPWLEGEPYLGARVAIDASGRALVTGTYTHDFGTSTAARVWAVEMAPDGAQLCNARLGLNDDAGQNPRTGYFAGGRAGVNVDTYGFGGMGPGSGGNWLVGLRGLP